ncbi:MAG TPA: divalent-cation tolerance protein CutA [Chromatiaceae bacterium]|jgi:periplasmic divalent cation tolerance protein|nr:divalent-cation tolerance protein CutA [Chromatiaceae bacterium]
MTSPVLIVLCTCPDADVAGRIATALVSEGLAACVNALPGVTSVYLWEGSVQTDTEVQLLIKTTAARLPALTDRVRALHPYELPEVIAVPVTGGLPDYLQWVQQCTAQSA